jgi:hypothetical protein
MCDVWWLHAKTCFASHPMIIELLLERGHLQEPLPLLIKYQTPHARKHPYCCLASYLFQCRI